MYFRKRILTYFNLKYKVSKSGLKGEILIPASKSHTIRAISIAAMANGKSVLKNPLVSADALSCVAGAIELGAKIETGTDYIVEGIGGSFSSAKKKVDVGNSGTSLRILTALASLGNHIVEFDGDSSIRKRPMTPLLSALENLGAKINSTGGKCPFTIEGPIKGGKTTVNGISSQFLTALLIACPLAEGDSEIIVENLHEQPYVEITLDWLKKQNVQYGHKNLDWFKIKGNQSYKPFDGQIPADFSSATFALCAAAITKSEILVKGLDFTDSQGDKVVFNHLEKMGVKLTHTPNGVLVTPGLLRGIEIDMNATPDALPALAVTACFAEGTTKLLNVKQARLKECDRIAAMNTELTKLGAKVTELEDGLIIEKSKLTPTACHGYDDHRMVMALSLAGMGCEGTLEVDTAEAVGITYPTFVDDFSSLGAKIEKMEKWKNG